MNSRLSIIIPTYNEGKNLKLLISEIVKSTQIKNYEIIVVDDNSSVKTYCISYLFKLEKKIINHLS
jgi:glycosyltransferase involved in cell wall biosynthesis